MKPQFCSPLGRILVLIFGLFAFLASPFRADAAACTTSDLASGSAAFVVNSTGTTTAGSVFLINASANTVQCSMTVGKDPTNLAVSPDGSLLFVENDADGTVTVLNLTDGTLNKTIPLTGTAMTANLAVSPDNSKVYVVTLPATLTASTQASLYVISLPALTLTASSPISVVAPSPATATPVTAPGLGVDFTPDSTKAYIATEGLTYIVTTSTDSISATTISASGGAAVVQPSGTFAYVIDVAANPTTATQINVSTNAATPQTPFPQCSTAFATAITPDSSRVYYTCPGTTFVQWIAAATNTCPGTGCNTITLTGHTTQGLAISSDGASVYVATSDGAIPVISVSTDLVAAMITGTSPLRGGGYRRPIMVFTTPTPPTTTQSVPVNASFQFAAVAKFVKNPATVSWSVTCTAGGAACGTIDATGKYTAPPTPPTPATVTVTASSSSAEFLYNPKFGSASVTVTVTTPAIIVSLAPASPTVGLDLTDTITATATNDTSGQGVTAWAVNNNPGGNSTVGTVVATDATHATYTAPHVLPPAPSMVTVTATSGADGTQTGSTTLTITSSVTVTVAPANPTLGINSQTKFTATVQGDSANLGVTWSLGACPVAPTTTPANPNPCGTLTAIDNFNVFYNAPPVVQPNSPLVTITATSVADTSKSGNSGITINSNVTVTVAPVNPTLGINTQTKFTATVLGDTSNFGVTWSLGACPVAPTVNPPNPNPCGTLTAIDNFNVFYSAPPVVQPNSPLVTITAKSVADTNKTGSSGITINSNVTVTVAPLNPTLGINSQTKFTATVAGDAANLGVTWSLGACPVAPTTTPANPNPCGTLTAIDNFNVFYNAPPVVQPNTPLVTITAKSVAATNKAGISAITINSNVTVTVAPVNPTLGINTQTKFTATVLGDTSNFGVTWSIACAATPTTNPANPNPCGTLTAVDGLNVFYNAPPVVQPNPPQVTITAKSVADTSKSGNSAMSINSAVTVSVTPLNPTLLINTQTKFTAAVLGDSSNFGVTWSLGACPVAPTTNPPNPNPCGTLTAIDNFNVFYNAPPVVQPNPPQVAIIATSLADTSKFGNSAITVNSNVTVAVTAPAPPVLINGTSSFVANTTNDGGLGVTWAIINCTLTPTTNPPNPVPCGSVNASTGAYTAPPVVPPAPSSIAVQATSKADPSKTSSAAVVITSNVSVSVTPATSTNTTVPIRFSITFTDAIQNSGSLSGVTWSLTCATGVTNCGSINAGTGMYTAPAVTPSTATATITATSQADFNKSGSSSITIVPDKAGIDPGAAQQLSIAIGTQTSAQTTIDLQGPIPGDGATFGLACSNFAGLSNASCTFSPSNPVSADASGTTKVTLTLSIVAAAAVANLNGPPFAQPRNAPIRGLLYGAVIPFVLFGLVCVRRREIVLPGPRHAFALVLLLCVCLGWMSACNQFSVPSVPGAPVPPTTAASGTLTVTITPSGGSFTTVTVSVPYSVK